MEFHPIPNFPDYFISRDGVIKSKKQGKEMIMKTLINKKGYEIIRLYNNKRKTKKVHRLVALTFIPNPENLPQVDHIDRNKQNNCVDNLRWVTSQENQINTSVNIKNKLGLKHIYFHDRDRKFRVKIVRDDIRYEEYFDNKFEAVAMRNAVLDELGERYDNIDNCK